MATSCHQADPALAPLPFSNRIVAVNSASSREFVLIAISRGLSRISRAAECRVTLRQRALIARRDTRWPRGPTPGKVPDYLRRGLATTNSW